MKHRDTPTLIAATVVILLGVALITIGVII